MVIGAPYRIDIAINKMQLLSCAQTSYTSIKQSPISIGLRNGKPNIYVPATFLIHHLQN